MADRYRPVAPRTAAPRTAGELGDIGCPVCGSRSGPKSREAIAIEPFKVFPMGCASKGCGQSARRFVHMAHFRSTTATHTLDRSAECAATGVLRRRWCICLAPIALIQPTRRTARFAGVDWQTYWPQSRGSVVVSYGSRKDRIRDSSRSIYLPAGRDIAAAPKPAFTGLDADLQLIS